MNLKTPSVFYFNHQSFLELPELYKLFVHRLCCIDGVRVPEMVQDKLWTAVNVSSFVYATTQYWLIWVNSFWRLEKCLSTVLPFLKRVSHFRLNVPSDQSPPEVTVFIDTT